jgi:glutathione synthase/RimK-type ligase-like ATP-grasp enzyme
MRWYIIVDNPKRWTFDVSSVEVLSSLVYVSDPQLLYKKRVSILNLCRSYAYQSLGYYVSLLAEARGHRVFPSVETIQDFKSPTVLRTLGADIAPIIQTALKPIQSDKFTLSIYFGRNLARRYDKLCRQLSILFPAPMVRAQFRKATSGWELENVSPIASKEIPESHREFVQEAASDFVQMRVRTTRQKANMRFDLAMLVDPKEAHPPSNEEALKKFEKAGERAGIRVQRITAEDYSDLAGFDGLFIRTTTSVEHYTYRFSRKAKAEGMVVIDDPLSILRCTNKVYLEEILSRKHIPTPRTLIIHKDNLQQALGQIGLPCILKQPDSSFSHGVVKIKTEEEYRINTRELLEKSDLLIAQEFLPTEYDWRIGILDGKPFYACRYFMARGHWQIYNHASKVKRHQDGEADCIPMDKVPQPILEAAIQGAALIGEGLYGVDLKLVDEKAYIIEINDNPSIDAKVEDDLAGDQLYDHIMLSFLRRMEAKRTKAAQNQ